MSLRPKAEGELNLIELGNRVRSERHRRGISLEQLSQRSGVSRSMISAVERGAKAATVLVLDRIATGLETSLARFLSSEKRSRVRVLRWKDQAVAHDPSGWERRILSPVLSGVEFEFMRTTLGPRVDAGLFLPHPRGSREYVAVEKGTLNLTLDGTLYALEAGDSIYYDGGCMHGFANPKQTLCVYYLAMDVSGDPAGTQHCSADEKVTRADSNRYAHGSGRRKAALAVADGATGKQPRHSKGGRRNAGR